MPPPPHDNPDGQTQTGQKDGDTAVTRTPTSFANRYEITRELGSGGMGVVYQAYDRLLDRSVALKILNPGYGSAETRSQGQQRLLREAQALAQLSHPNVIAVHDVGEANEQIFVAMELLRGQDLKQWLTTNSQEKRHSWRQVVEVFLQAARGLAAAHQAGLVHRDFKPANAFLGEDGRVRVLDFGLARAKKPAGSPQDNSAPLEVALTQPGSILGTPAYMSPEQHRGERADPQSDQFSFFVALWEALHNKRPFAGSTTAEFLSQIEAGPPPGPHDQKLPKKLRRLLRAGLTADPTQRLSDMTAVVDQLQHLLRPPRYGFALAAAALAATLVITATVVSIGESDRCLNPAQHLTGVWDPHRRQAVSTALTSLSASPHTVEHTLAILDRHAQQWSSEYQRACDATWNQGKQSQELLDLRMLCLQRRANELFALSQLMIEEMDASVKQKATTAALSLPPIHICADLDRLTSHSQLPESPAKRQQVIQSHKELARIAALKSAGKYQIGLEESLEVLQQAKNIGHPPLVAAATYAWAELLDYTGQVEQAETELRRAAKLAALASDDLHLARSWVSLVFVVGVLQGRQQEALDFSDFAETMATRSKDTGIVADFFHNKGSLLLAMGQKQQALEAFTRAMEGRRLAYGEDHPKVASTLGNIAITQYRSGHLEKAEQAHQQALQLEQRVHGTEHPVVAKRYTNLAAVASARDDKARALSLETQALAIRQKTLGDQHYQTGISFSNLGNYLVASGKCPEALNNLQNAQKIFAQTLPPKHIYHSSVLLGRGECLTKMGQPKKAAPLLQKALATATSVKDQQMIAHCQLALALAKSQLGHKKQALQLAKQAHHNYLQLTGQADNWIKQAQDLVQKLGG